MFAVPAALAPLVYGLLNIASATGIVFANKAGKLGGARGKAAICSAAVPLPAARTPCSTADRRRNPEQGAPRRVGLAPAAAAAQRPPLC